MNPEKNSFSGRGDWSSLMTSLYDELETAEQELRQLHMGEAHKNEARIQLDRAMISLKLLRGWCDG